MAHKNENILKAQKMAVVANKLRLRERLKRLAEKNKSCVEVIDHRVALLMLAMLYWGEGSKYPSVSMVRFGNSDPGMIRLFMVLLRKCFTIDEGKFRGVLQCRADQNQLDLEQYWSEVSDIPLSKFNRAVVDSRTRGKPTLKSDYKGVFVVHYFDTDLQLELQYLSRYLGDEWARSSLG